MLNQETLKKYLTYDPETGLFRWKIARGKIKVGEVAGTTNNYGYICIKIFYKKYKAHRLAWLYTYGEFPEDQMDHINRIKNDNRIANLRAVTHTENMKNRSLQSSNTSGHAGVYWIKDRQKQWRVRVKNINYGYFKSKQDAIKKAKEAYKELGFHENHGRVLETNE
jgi:hypothetical protein